jgi:uncharacterized protein
MSGGHSDSVTGDFEAMSREFPDFIDPWKSADGQREFRGTMPLKRMQRLRPMLAPEQEAAAAGKEQGAEKVVWKDAGFHATFAHDEQGMVTIALEVNAELPLICQRSLVPYLERVERQSLLTVIEDIAEQETVPDSYEPVLVEHSRLALQDLVEDELLLAVPQVPRNPDTEIVKLSTDGVVETPSETEKEKTHRPFEGLLGLMKEIVED